MQSAKSPEAQRPRCTQGLQWWRTGEVNAHRQGHTHTHTRTYTVCTYTNTLTILGITTQSAHGHTTSNTTDSWLVEFLLRCLQGEQNSQAEVDSNKVHLLQYCT